MTGLTKRGEHSHHSVRTLSKRIAPIHSDSAEDKMTALVVGELKGLAFGVSATTVRSWLREAGLGPAGRRGGMTWRDFVRGHRRSLLAVAFFTVETIWLQRLYVMFFIELGSRRVHLAGSGCTPNPTTAWVTHQARQVTWKLAEGQESFRFRSATGTRSSRTL